MLRIRFTYKKTDNRWYSHPANIKGWQKAYRDHREAEKKWGDPGERRYLSPLDMAVKHAQTKLRAPSVKTVCVTVNGRVVLHESRPRALPYRSYRP